MSDWEQRSRVVLPQQREPSAAGEQHKESQNKLPLPHTAELCNTAPTGIQTRKKQDPLLRRKHCVIPQAGRLEPDDL